MLAELACPFLPHGWTFCAVYSSLLPHCIIVSACPDDGWVTKDRNSFLRSSLAAGREWPLSLRIYFWFSHLCFTNPKSYYLPGSSSLHLWLPKVFPHSNSLQCLEFLESSCAFFSLSSLHYFNFWVFPLGFWGLWKTLLCDLPCSTPCQPCFGGGGQKCCSWGVFWPDCQWKPQEHLASIAKIVQFIGGAVHTSRTRVIPPAGGWKKENCFDEVLKGWFTFTDPPKKPLTAARN